jgi:acyl-CoA thioester hydrolase
MGDFCSEINLQGASINFLPYLCGGIQGFAMHTTEDFDPTCYAHQTPIHVRFSDLDALGHVNNAKYLTYLEESRVAWFSDVTGMPNNSIDWEVILARIEIDFLRSAMLGDKVTVHTRCAKIGTKSLNLESLIMVERNGESFPTAWYRATMVWFDYKTQTTIPVPADFRNKVNAHQGTFL